SLRPPGCAHCGHGRQASLPRITADPAADRHDRARYELVVVQHVRGEERGDAAEQDPALADDQPLTREHHEDAPQDHEERERRHDREEHGLARDDDRQRTHHDPRHREGRHGPGARTVMVDRQHLPDLVAMLPCCTAGAAHRCDSPIAETASSSTIASIESALTVPRRCICSSDSMSTSRSGIAKAVNPSVDPSPTLTTTAVVTARAFDSSCAIDEFSNASTETSSVSPSFSPVPDSGSMKERTCRAKSVEGTRWKTCIPEASYASHSTRLRPCTSKRQK